MVSSLYTDDVQSWVVLDRNTSGSVLSGQRTALPGTDMQSRFAGWPFPGKMKTQGRQAPAAWDEWPQELLPLLSESAPQILGLWPKAPRQPQERMLAHGHLWSASQEMLCQPCALPLGILAVPGLISTSPDIYLFIPLDKSLPLCWAMPACCHNSPSSPRSF